MIILDSATKSLEVLLGGAVTTNQLEWVASWVDIIGGPPPTSFLSGAADGVTNNGTAVTLVAAPGATTQRQVKVLTVYNADTVAATVTVRYKDVASLRRTCVVALAAGSTLFYTDGEGFRVLNKAGEILGTGSGSGGSSSSGVILTADPASPSDDTWWVVRTGTTAGSTVTGRGQIAGTLYDFWSYTL